MGPIRGGAIVLALALLGAAQAGAASFVVDTQLDSGDTNPGDGNCRNVESRCSLRAAVQEANALGGATAHQITLPVGSFEVDVTAGAGEDAAASGDIDVTARVEIEGAGVDATIIEGGGDGTREDRVLHVLPSGDLTLRDLTLRDGRATGASGGGVRNEGVLSLSGCVVADNQADAGGGIHSSGLLLLEETTVSSNEAEDAGGGGVLVSAGSLEARESTFSGNIASFDGTAIRSDAAASLVLENCTLSGQFGPAAALRSGDTPTTLTHVTITGNGGIGLSVSSTAADPLQVVNSIVAEASSPDCLFGGSSPPLLSSSHSLSSDASCSFQGSGDLENTDPLLGPLQQNGGPTETRRPLSSASPAVDAGADDPLCLPFDQRGVVRPQDGNGDLVAACDIGAVEFAPEALGVGPGLLALAAAAGLAWRRRG